MLDNFKIKSTDKKEEVQNHKGEYSCQNNCFIKNKKLIKHFGLLLKHPQRKRLI